MPGTLLHGGDLSWGAWLVILVVVLIAAALVAAVFLAAFIRLLKLINKRSPPVKAVAVPAGGQQTERTRNE